MKGLTKKWLVIVLSVFILLALAAGCSSKNEGEKPSASPANTAAAGTSPSPEGSDVYPNGLSKSEQVTIKFGFWENGYGREWIDNAIAKFTETYPNVKFDVAYSPKIMDLISTKIAAKNDKDMFDIISPAFNSKDEKVQVIKAGMFEDLTDLWDRVLPDANGLKLRDLVPEGTFEFAEQYDNKFYEIPMGGSTVGLFYDKALFEQNGWNENPKTWEEFLELLEAIKSKGIIPITYPGVHPSYLSFAFGIKQFELAEKNGDLEGFTQRFRQSQLPIYTSDESKEVWTRIYELGKKGYFPAGVAALNHTQSQMQLLQHKAALAATGDWVQNEMKDSIPDGFKWGFMAIPFSSKAGDNVWVENYIGAGGIMIWKNKSDLVKNWAKEFNMFLLTNDVQAYNNKFAGIYPIRKDFLDNPENIKEMQDAPRAIMEFAKQNKMKLGLTSKEVIIGGATAAQADKLTTEMINEVTIGKKDPIPVLEEAEKLIEKAIKENSK
ncbi:ABC transporter substrate-binding protein [Paenibacillus eucommiae]|uniref:N-acetylglucosamine transport system substrate-binding protein n=1 Tax=Paenibacillus eucommiae TaxID=1355755 RepID=A0ABS4ISZ7_9BACL|nr:extracellular solute-binding protein [Paenibacillus eucommiae]MBP1990151.1 N-acetylglucosamine transport system substrate-binding protein [Paenibacillus eucommiae]